MYIRRATPDDALAIKTAHCNAYKISYRGYLPDDVLDAKKVDEDVLNSARIHLAKAECYLAIEDNKVLSFAYVSYPEDDDKCFEIQAIYTDPIYQKQGAGSSLVTYLCAEKKKLGYQKLRVWTLKHGPSLGFYQKQGFDMTAKAEKIWRYNLSVIMLEKQL